MMKTLLTLSLLLLIPAAAVGAAENEKKTELKQYDVEIILFEDVHSRYLNSQTWAQETKVKDSLTAENQTKVVESTGQVNKEIHTDITPVILKSEFKRIKVSKEYKVLFYGSWRQAGLNKEKAFTIDIEKLKNLHKSTSANTITGNLKLVLARYLHIYGELDYQINNSDTVVATKGKVTENKSYPMNIHRRMRSKELHYIDHPLVGILIQINPSPIKKADVTAQSEQ